MEVLEIKRYSELAEDIKPIAMANYIDEFCAYAELDGEVTAEDIEENGILFNENGEIFTEELVWMCVYRDTIEKHDEDWNLSEVLVVRDFARQYFEECQAKNYDESIVFENWIMNYDADDTEDFYDYAMKHNAVLDIDHWK